MEMNQPVGKTPLDDRPDGLVGRPIDRIDGRLKVMGRAPYAYETREVKNPAYGFIVGATIAAGTIRSIDTAAAAKAPGVIHVMTHENVPEQGEKKEQVWPQLAGTNIGFFDQPVAFVVAETFEQARAAAKLVKVAYDVRAPKASLRAALPQAVEPKKQQTDPDSKLGDFDGAFAAAPVKLDVEYTTPTQIHAQMEPHATIASWEGDKVVLYTANQMLNRGQKSLASVLKLPVENVRLVSHYIGGGFGSKLQPMPEATLAALASKAIQRPVKVALTRQQEFHVATHRTDTIQRIRLASDRDGRLTALSHESWSDTAQGDEFYETSANVTRSLYAAPNRITRHRLAKLDLPIASSMRAPGEAVGMLAFECAMDELAEQIGLDPIELRIRNEPTQDPEKQVPFTVRQLVPCMREGAKLFGWDRRKAAGTVRDGNWMVGMGMSAAARLNPLMPSSASVKLGADGYLTVRMAMTDIGTGTYTILAQIAGEMMGLPVERIRVEIGDTAYPAAAGSGGSFGAGSAGSALYVACDNLRNKLVAATDLNPDGVVFADGRVTSGNRSEALIDLAGSGGVAAEGEIKPGALKEKFSHYSFGAHFAEVGVDRDTGEIRLRRMLGVFTGGRILNAKTARSQAIGGMTFGVGAALMEDAVIDPRTATYVNHDLAEYHVPVHADIPAMDAVFLPERDDKANPLKSKGLGELGICGAGAALANAVYNATGIRIRDYPLTLDKVLKGFEEQEGRAPRRA
ncbi:xanthine dehydrogenase family protein molybdopterin-binding subunit [Methylobacterium sp. WL30]|uniref:xanthine dehydrogenase family protein molybdopterin-binding subunit n=1 Tax=unclassified Methylobacterium TaxID=2615210 RepID=UPI0011CCA86C|nr:MULTISPECIES: xanthine dehydrogenase family protein molybdopterin-binding subunit [unclassified Methylobacterium]TXN38862.1 xanthine dehydrogenase family protein molybdopterin-binding subunit [Methylobacterium sp. WL93]TXN50110.1 xanthine dehydrogenase family protein molybdopterin-binding subunit [Methylobacterium sp. WL119]TXN65923.1 xanthine dehydrogenase family protein molybdopterin-binding subunit [Methylobacterium sp. WL30]